MDSRVFSSARLAAVVLAVLLNDASGARADVRVVPPDEVTTDWMETRDGVTYLTVDGRRWDLITDPESPEISTLGDGSFHPMAAQEVERAVAAALGDLRQELPTRIFILPYPRRETLRSSCEDGVIFLSPGIRHVSVAHIHATVAHEIGHVIQQTWAPEGSQAWREYCVIRGLDPARSPETTEHRKRPREIFAEDFRLLRGGTTASGAGGHENADLPAPALVPGLSEWFLRLTRQSPLRVQERGEAHVSPNPFRLSMGTGIEIRFAAGPEPGTSAHADIYDLAGRSIAELPGQPSSSETVRFLWNGRDHHGRSAAPGVFFVRWREHPERQAARVHILH